MENTLKDKSIFSNYNDSHQSQPWCIVSFLNFKNPSQTVNISDMMAVTNNTIVSDVLSCNISSNKNGHVSTAELTLASGATNYQSVLSPGDHVLIWLGDSTTDYEAVFKSAKQSKKCNHYNSGLKFMGKVNSVRTMFSTQSDGSKTVRYLVTCKAFSEFDIQVYFNPLFKPPKGKDQSDLNYNTSYLARVSQSWLNKLTTGGLPFQIIDYIDFFIDTFLGVGPPSSKKTAKKTEGDKEDSSLRSTNGAMVIPAELERMLGARIDGLKTYSKICNRYYGIQKYYNKYEPTINNTILGSMAPPPDLFNNTVLWGSMQSLSNSNINEMYVTLRADADGDILPAFIARQIPFTSDKLNILRKSKGKPPIESTLFSTLPRWKIDSSRCIQSFNIGTSDAMRFNFVQVFGSNFGYHGGTPQEIQAIQTALKNYEVYDNDITRHGPRNLIQSTLCNTAAEGLSASLYVDLIADWYRDAQLKFTGSVSVSGIKEPICIGDNLQIDDKLFHIESVIHSYSCSDNGMKSFTTNISLSHGTTIFGGFSNDTSKQPNYGSDFVPGSGGENEDRLDSSLESKPSKNKVKAMSGLSDRLFKRVRKQDTSE